MLMSACRCLTLLPCKPFQFLDFAVPPKKIGLTLPTKPPLFALPASTRCHTRSTALPYVRIRLLSPPDRSCLPALSSTIHIARTCSRPIEALRAALAPLQPICLPRPPALPSTLMISFHFRFGFGSGSGPSSLSYTWSLLSLPYTTTLRSISILRFHCGPTIYALSGVLPCGQPLCPVDSPFALWTALYTHTPTFRPSPTPYHPHARISIFHVF